MFAGVLLLKHSDVLYVIICYNMRKSMRVKVYLITFKDL